MHLRHRPESGGAIVHLIKTGQGNTIEGHPSPTVLNSMAVQTSFTTNNSYFLSQAFPEGSPIHPSYGDQLHCFRGALSASPPRRRCGDCQGAAKACRAATAGLSAQIAQPIQGRAAYSTPFSGPVPGGDLLSSEAIPRPRNFLTPARAYLKITQSIAAAIATKIRLCNKRSRICEPRLKIFKRNPNKVPKVLDMEPQAPFALRLNYHQSERPRLALN